jgi:DNA-binding CsgD family transcriptional regulator
MEYGAQSQNWSVAQSPVSGWMYFGNNTGLLEFDGARWNTYNLPQKQTIRAVAPALDGRVYCGGFATFGYWERQKDNRLVYTSLSDQVQSENLEKEEIWHILIHGDKVLFQSFSTIYCYENGRITVLKPPGAIMFLQSLNDRLLFQVIGKGIYELMPDHVFRFLEGSAVMADKIIQFIIPGDQGDFWVGTAKDGVWQFSKSKMQPWRNPLNQLFKRYQLNKALVLSDGRWAIGTILNGLYIIEPSGTLQMHLNRENGLQNNTVLALHEDQSKNIWAGLDKGIDFIELNSPLRFFIDQSGRIGSVYTAVQYQNSLFVGTNQGVFQRIYQNEQVAFRLVEGTQGQVWDLQVFDNQLICGHNDGTFLIERGQAIKISTVTGGWQMVPIPGMPDVLLQCTYTGLTLFKKNEAGLWRFSHKIEGFSAPLRKIIFDVQGYLWGVHPNKGLFRMRLSEDLTLVTEQRAYTKADGLPSEQSIDLVKIKDQILINHNGVPFQISFDRDKVQFTPSNIFGTPGKILNGADGDYFRVDYSSLWMERRNRKNSLPISLIPGYEKVIDLGELGYLFCQENGYSILDKNKLDTRTMKPAKAQIRQLSAGNVVFPLSESMDKIIVPNRQNSLKFEFCVNAFGGKPKFSWYLEGFNNRWSDWSFIPEKDFTNLRPGQYVLHLKSDFSEEERTLKFEILPPWYLSIWAYFIYALVGILLLYLIEQYNQYRLGQQRKMLEKEKERELARQKDEAERDKLSMELNIKSRELSNAALGLIRKNEMLQKIKDDLQTSKGDARALSKLSRSIDGHLESDHDWEIFEHTFNEVHDQFFKRLMNDYPELTPGDLRLAAYLKMNLSSKEIAPLFNISIRGVENKRYRLRKKIGLSEEANLTEFMMNY